MLKLFLKVCGLLLILINILSAEIVETATLPDGTDYVSDKFIIAVTDNVSLLDISYDKSGNIQTGILSLDLLCNNFKILNIEPFYKGELSEPSLIKEISKIYIITISDKEMLFHAISAFNQDNNIDHAELFTLPKLMYEPNDPHLYEQWYLYHTQVTDAWDIIRGDTTRHSIIAIVDTGIDWDHPEIQPNIWVNEPEDLNGNGILDDGDINGIDDDNNGYIDDVIGWDHGDSDNDPQEGVIIHGTPVASCASAATDNGMGIAAPGFSARIMGLKGVSNQGTPIGFWQSIIYAADNGAHIINCSWATLIYSQIEQNIINSVHEAGALIIASAAATSDTIPGYPCGYDNVMAVTSTDQNDYKASFADYGSWVDISAPGVDIIGVYADNYNYYSGTSFSAALVSGLAGLIWAWYPLFTNDEIQQIIEDTADPIDYLNPAFACMLGAGRINAFNCIVTGIETLPNTPDNFTLSQNHPNPFNASTMIGYSLSEPTNVIIEIYDILGRKIETIFEGEQTAGEHQIIWNADDHPSGVYFYRISAGNYVETKKMVLLK